MSRIAASGGVRQREPRVRDREHMAKIAALPCIACLVRGVRTWPVEVAHVKIGYPLDGWRAFGHSERAHDHRTVPLCARDHREGPQAQHANRGGDEREYWTRLGIHPPALCAALVEAFAAGDPGLKVLRAFAAEARLHNRT